MWWQAPRPAVLLLVLGTLASRGLASDSTGGDEDRISLSELSPDIKDSVESALDVDESTLSDGASFVLDDSTGDYWWDPFGDQSLSDILDGKYATELSKKRCDDWRCDRWCYSFTDGKRKWRFCTCHYICEDTVTEVSVQVADRHGHHSLRYSLQRCPAVAPRRRRPR
jgi:hypothetical protein